MLRVSFISQPRSFFSYHLIFFLLFVWFNWWANHLISSLFQIFFSLSFHNHISSHDSIGEAMWFHKNLSSMISTNFSKVRRCLIKFSFKNPFKALWINFTREKLHKISKNISFAKTPTNELNWNKIKTIFQSARTSWNFEMLLLQQFSEMWHNENFHIIDTFLLPFSELTPDNQEVKRRKKKYYKFHPCAA